MAKKLKPIKNTQLEHDIDALQSKADNNESVNTSQQSAISTNLSLIGNNITLISDLQDEDVVLAGDIATNAGLISTNATNIAALQTEVAGKMDAPLLAVTFEQIHSDNTTSETVVWAPEISEDLWGVLSRIEAMAYCERTSGSGTVTGKIYLNSAPTLDGNQKQYGTSASTTTKATWESRIGMVDSSTQFGQPETAGTQWTVTGVGGNWGSSSFPNNAPIYVIFTLTKSVGTDVAKLKWGTVKISRY